MRAITATIEPAGLPPGPLTVADREGMPDGGHRCELLDGVLIVSPPPGTKHQLLVLELGKLLDNAGPAEFLILVAPFAVRPQGHQPLSEQRTELQPDVLVSLARDFTERDLPKPPMLAVEVLSPSTRLIDLSLKRAAYGRMGVASFGLIDPKTVQLWAHELDDDGGYRLIAHVQGEQVFQAQRPFPVAVRPADLLRRRPTPAEPRPSG